MCLKRSWKKGNTNKENRYSVTKKTDYFWDDVKWNQRNLSTRLLRKDCTFHPQQRSCRSDRKTCWTEDKPELLHLSKLYPNKTLVSREATISLSFSKTLLSCQIVSCEKHHLSPAAVSTVSKHKRKRRIMQRLIVPWSRRTVTHHQWPNMHEMKYNLSEVF